MERLQGPINPCFLGEHLDVGCLEQGFVNTGSLGLDEDDSPFPSSPGLEDNKMPFLQMLQSAELSQPFFPFKEPSFQTLLKLQHLKKPWDMNNTFMPDTDTHFQALEHESCVTHDIADLHSPVKSETKELLQNPHLNSCLEAEGASPETRPDEKPTISTEPHSGSSLPWTNNSEAKPNEVQHSNSPPAATRERRKRKRVRTAKNKEEVESQRMTHIAVERNRRRQMNDHLNCLRSLMPPSYVQRGDQASIIGGAIDFVKELEQLLQSLEAQKRIRTAEAAGVAISPKRLLDCDEGGEGEDETKVKKNLSSDGAGIQVTAIQDHVNLKIQCQRKPGQLLRAIVALEGLRLTVLHLNITSAQNTALYSFNLKIEEDCNLRSAEEVAAAVHQIFSIINSS